MPPKKQRAPLGQRRRSLAEIHEGKDNELATQRALTLGARDRLKHVASPKGKDSRQPPKTPEPEEKVHEARLQNMGGHALTGLANAGQNEQKVVEPITHQPLTESASINNESNDLGGSGNHLGVPKVSDTPQTSWGSDFTSDVDTDPEAQTPQSSMLFPHSSMPTSPSPSSALSSPDSHPHTPVGQNPRSPSADNTTNTTSNSDSSSSDSASSSSTTTNTTGASDRSPSANNPTNLMGSSTADQSSMQDTDELKKARQRILTLAYLELEEQCKSACEQIDSKASPSLSSPVGSSPEQSQGQGTLPQWTDQISRFLATPELVDWFQKKNQGLLFIENFPSEQDFAGSVCEKQKENSTEHTSTVGGAKLQELTQQEKDSALTRYCDFIRQVQQEDKDILDAALAEYNTKVNSESQSQYSELKETVAFINNYKAQRALRRWPLEYPEYVALGPYQNNGAEEQKSAHLNNGLKVKAVDLFELIIKKKKIEAIQSLPNNSKKKRILTKLTATREERKKYINDMQAACLAFLSLTNEHNNNSSGLNRSVPFNSTAFEKFAAPQLEALEQAQSTLESFIQDPSASGFSSFLSNSSSPSRSSSPSSSPSSSRLTVTVTPAINGSLRTPNRKNQSNPHLTVPSSPLNQSIQSFGKGSDNLSEVMDNLSQISEDFHASVNDLLNHSGRFADVSGCSTPKQPSAPGEQSPMNTPGLSPVTVDFGQNEESKEASDRNNPIQPVNLADKLLGAAAAAAAASGSGSGDNNNANPGSVPALGSVPASPSAHALGSAAQEDQVPAPRSRSGSGAQEEQGSDAADNANPAPVPAAASRSGSPSGQVPVPVPDPASGSDALLGLGLAADADADADQKKAQEKKEEKKEEEGAAPAPVPASPSGSDQPLLPLDSDSASDQKHSKQKNQDPVTVPGSVPVAANNGNPGSGSVPAPGGKHSEPAPAPAAVTVHEGGLAADVDVNVNQVPASGSVPAPAEKEKEKQAAAAKKIRKYALICLFILMVGAVCVAFGLSSNKKSKASLQLDVSEFDHWDNEDTLMRTFQLNFFAHHLMGVLEILTNESNTTLTPGNASQVITVPCSLGQKYLPPNAVTIIDSQGEAVLPNQWGPFNCQVPLKATVGLSATRLEFRDSIAWLFTPSINGHFPVGELALSLNGIHATATPGRGFPNITLQCRSDDKYLPEGFEANFYRQESDSFSTPVAITRKNWVQNHLSCVPTPTPPVAVYLSKVSREDTSTYPLWHFNANLNATAGTDTFVCLTFNHETVILNDSVPQKALDVLCEQGTGDLEENIAAYRSSASDCSIEGEAVPVIPNWAEDTLSCVPTPVNPSATAEIQDDLTMNPSLYLEVSADGWVDPNAQIGVQWSSKIFQEPTVEYTTTWNIATGGVLIHGGQCGAQGGASSTVAVTLNGEEIPANPSSLSFTCQDQPAELDCHMVNSPSMNPGVFCVGTGGAGVDGADKVVTQLSSDCFVTNPVENRFTWADALGGISVNGQCGVLAICPFKFNAQLNGQDLPVDLPDPSFICGQTSSRSIDFFTPMDKAEVSAAPMGAEPTIMPFMLLAAAKFIGRWLGGREEVGQVPAPR